MLRFRAQGMQGVASQQSGLDLVFFVAGSPPGPPPPSGIVQMTGALQRIGDS